MNAPPVRRAAVHHTWVGKTMRDRDYPETDLLWSCFSLDFNTCITDIKWLHVHMQLYKMIIIIKEKLVATIDIFALTDLHVQMIF